MAQFMLLLLLATIQLPLVSAAKFHFNNETKSWIDALEHCKNRGYFLAEIINDNMWGTVKTHLKGEITNMQDGAWIGLERSIFANNIITWTWVLKGNESPLPTHWNKSSPIDRFNYHCGKIIWAQENELKLLDDSCHRELPFICQELSQV